MKKITFIIVCAIVSFSNAQITLVKDFAGSASGNPGHGTPDNCYAFQDKLYFTVVSPTNNRGIIYTTDGTETGTLPLQSNSSTASRLYSENPEWTELDNKLYVVAVNSASSTGTFIFYGTSNNVQFNLVNMAASSPSGLTTNDSELFFVAGDVVYGRELRSLDLDSNLKRLTNLNSSYGSGSNIDNITFLNDNIFFSGDDGTYGVEPWLNNTISNTNIQLGQINIHTNINGGSSNPHNVVKIDNQCYFLADSCCGNHVYKINSNSTMSYVAISNYAYPYPQELIHANINGKDYLVCSTWIYPNNTTERRELVFLNTANDDITEISINVGPNASNPSGFTVFNNYVYFSANNGSNGVELYRSQGTVATTELVMDINPSGNSNPANFMEYNGELYFSANDGVNGKELWKVDTNNNVTLVENFTAGSGSFFPIPLAVMDNKLFLSGMMNNTERELYSYIAPTLSTTTIEQTSNIVLTPNPTQNTFKIEYSNFQIEEVSIININGKQIKMFKEQQELYDISELQSGLYFINIKTDLGHMISRKLIKE